MWDDKRQQRLDSLREKPSTTLSDAEEQELSLLLAELEQEEWRVLQPALHRLREQQDEVQDEFRQVTAENAFLAAFISRQEDLLYRARQSLESFTREQEALQKTYERIIGQP
jgi:hypothetical protein